MTDSPAQLPFNQAIEFFKNKIQLPTASWTDIWEQQHSHAFVVAGAAQDALVEDFYNAIQSAKWGGGGYEDFRKQFDAIVTKHGWSYNGSAGWRSKIIYDTNINQSYNAGRYQQMVAVKHLRPYWEYDHTSIEHPRLEHKAWDGLILSADDVWWDTHMPQNGWGCRCRVNSLSNYEAEQAWQAKGMTGPDTAPPIEWEEKTVGSKGASPRTVKVPKGIDPGFAYNPGKAYLEPLTVPPLTGNNAVLTVREKPWPSDFKPPKMPTPTKVSPNIRQPRTTPKSEAVDDLLGIFGADQEQGAAFIDKANTPMAITKALFDDGSGPLSAVDDRMVENMNLLAMTLLEPDEIWWAWEKDKTEPGRWRLKRRYLRLFEIEGQSQRVVAVFDWKRTGWKGDAVEIAEDGFDQYRDGRLLYIKE